LRSIAIQCDIPVSPINIGDTGMKKVQQFALIMFLSLMKGVSAQSVFEGSFVQVAIGYTNVRATFNQTSTLLNQVGVYPQNFSTDNLSVLTGNIGGGYNFRIDSKWLLGLSVDFMPLVSGSANSKVTTNLPGIAVPNSLTGSYQMKNPLNFSVIPSYELSSTQLVYGKIALSTAQLIYSDPTTPATNVLVGGYTLGLGYKQSLENQLYVFAEGLYTNFVDYTANINGPYVGIANTSITVKATGYTGLVGIGYRF
jgi:hypothetical protein